MKHHTTALSTRRIFAFILAVLLLSTPGSNTWLTVAQAFASETVTSDANAAAPSVEQQPAAEQPSAPAADPAPAEATAPKAESSDTAASADTKPDSDADTSSDEDVPSDDATPADSDAPADDATPTDSDAPSDDAAPTDSDVPAVDAIPTDGDVQAGDAAPTDGGAQTAADETLTPAPSVTPEALDVEDTITRDGYTYLYANSDKTYIYSSESLAKSKRIGVLSGTNVLVCATCYVEREEHSTAILVNFNTEDGVKNGFVFADDLSSTPISLAQVKEIIEQGDLDYVDCSCGGSTVSLITFGYEKYIQPTETQQITQEESETATEASDPLPTLPPIKLTVEDDETEAPASDDSTTSEPGDTSISTDAFDLAVESDETETPVVEDTATVEPSESPLQTEPVDPLLVEPAAEESTEAPMAGFPEMIGTAVVTSESGAATLYLAPALESEAVASLPNETLVAVVGSEGEWTHIYVTVEQTYLEGYLQNVCLVAVAPTEAPVTMSAPAADGFVPMQPGEVPGYYLSIGTVQSEPAVNEPPETTDETQTDILSKVYHFFIPCAYADDMGSPSADIYTFIGADGVQYYRIYGTVDGVEGYYACDENGTAFVPYQLVDIEAEKAELAVGTPSISLRGLANFALTPPLTAPTPPSYYHSFPAGVNTTVYTFVGRDGVRYHRIYGTNASNVTGFFACDQYGENEAATPVDLDNEYITIAPIDYEGKLSPTAPAALTQISTDPILYSYPDSNGGTQYRLFGAKLNDPADTADHWYATDETGTVISQLLNDDIQLDVNNLWSGGFIETLKPSTVALPAFYGSIGSVDNTATIKARNLVWAYTDRAGTLRYRVYGTVNGVAGFYECNAQGNVTSLTPVDMEKESMLLSPLKNGIADTYIPGYARVTATTVVSIADGTPVWDATTSGIDTATLGNDANADNRVVRSFDQVSYELDLITELNSQLPDGTDISNYKGFNSAKAYLRFVVPNVNENDVSFIMSDMSWLTDGKAVYDAAARTWTLSGYRQLESSNGNVALPNRTTMNVVMRVNGAANGSMLFPTSNIWLDQGTDAAGNDLNANYVPTLAERSTAMQPVRVTAAPKYNVRVQYVDWTSRQLLMDPVAGKIDQGTQDYFHTHLAFTCEIRNDTVEKGLKGVEFPAGDFTFDTTVTVGKTGYSLDLWDYCDETGFATSGVNGRQLFANNAARYTALDSNGVSADMRNTERLYYDGGSVIISVQNINDLSKRLHVTIKDYRIDGIFPKKALSDANNITYGANEGVFSVVNVAMYTKTNAVTTTTTIPMTATVNTLSATSASGVVTNQDVYAQDNQVSPSFTLYPPGNLSKMIAMFTPDTLTSAQYQNALGTARRGDEVHLMTMIGGTQNATNNRVGAYNLFTKFDAEGFTATGFNNYIYVDKANILYGALPTGGNWASDAAMQGTREEALEWYSSLADMGTKKCVAVLVEFRGEGYFIPNATLYIQPSVVGYVPTTARVNRVYQAVSDYKYWFNDVGAGMTAETNTVTNNLGAANPRPSGAQFTNATAIAGVTTNPYVKRTYNMTTYQTTGGHTGGWVWGTSWLVKADFVDITKNVAQTIDSTAVGAEKTIFSLNNGERRVDYVITPTYATGGDAAGGTNGTVTIKDTLPKYLTYVPGSSFVGGSYVFDTDSQKSHHTGGTAKEPTVSVNATTGVTTLTWTFTLPPSAHDDPMENMYFSAVIGDENDPAKDPANNTALLNSVDISATTAVETATASKAITVANLAEMTISKHVAKDKVELGEPVVFNLTINNNSITNQTNLLALDILPYIGDERHTDYAGNYQVTKIVVEQTSTANTNLSMQTTNDEAVRAMNLRSADLQTGVAWASPVPVVSNGGKTSTYTINGPLTGLLFSAPLFEAKGRAKVTITLLSTNNAATDVYANNASMDGDNFAGIVTTPVISATVVQRSISGLAWIDVSKDGRRDSYEIPVEGVEVQLYKITRDAAGAVVSTTLVTADIEGTPYGTVITDAEGKYKFDKLPAGEYQVRFEGHDNITIDKWQTTVLEAAAVPESSNSNAAGTYTGDTLDYANIDAIMLPEADAITIGVFNNKFEDVGFTTPFAFEKLVSPAAGTPLHEGDILTYTLNSEFPAAGVTRVSVTDQVPKGTLFVPGSVKYKLASQASFTTVTDAAYSYQTNVVTFPFVDLDRGINTFTFQVVVDKLPDETGSLDLENTAKLVVPTGAEVISNTTKNTVTTRYATISKTAALVTPANTLEATDRGTETALVKTDAGQQVEYILTVTALGDDTLTSGDLIVSDPTPKGTTAVAGSLWGKMVSSAAGSTAAGLNTGTIVTTVNGATVHWTLTGFKTGDVAELHFRVTAPTTVDPTTQKAQFLNQATLLDKEQTQRTFDANAVRVTRDAEGNVLEAENVTENTAIYTTEDATHDSEITYHEVLGVPRVTAAKSAKPLPNGTRIPVVKDGDTIMYYVALTNDGDGDAHDVLAYDAIPVGTTYVPDSAQMDGVNSGEYLAGSNAVQWMVPFIAPGHTVQLSFKVSVNAGTDAQLITNVARYSDPEDPNNPGDPNDWPETNPVDYQKTAFSKASDPAGGTTEADATNVKVGDVIHYTLALDTVAELHHVIMSDNMPDGLRLEQDSIGYTLADGTTVQLADTYLVGNKIKWPSIDTLPAGHNVFTFSVVVERLDGLYSAQYENFGTVAYDDNRKNGTTVIKDTNHVTHEASVSMPEIHKTSAVVVNDVAENYARGEQDDPIQVYPWQQVEYILTVTGHGADSGEIVVTDVMPAGSTFVDAWGVNVTFSAVGNGLEVSHDTPSAGNGQTLTVKLNQLSDMQVATIRFRVNAPELTGGALETFFENTAALENPSLRDVVYQGDFTDSNGVTHHAGDPVYTEAEINQQSETTYHVVRDSLLAMVKTATPAYVDGIAPIVKAGDTLTYALTITNSGLASALNVYVRDIIPQGTTYTDGSADNGGVYDAVNNRIQWVIPEIPANTVATVTFAVTINPITDAMLIQNAAAYREVPIPPDDPDAAEDPEHPWVPTNPTQHQTIFSEKSVMPTDEIIREGKKLTYTIKVKVATTDGGLAKGVVITDALPAGLSLVAGSIKIRNAKQSDDCYADGVITWPATDLPDGETLFSYSAIVDKLPADTYRLDIANTALVNNVPTNTVETQVLARASSIVKEARLVVNDVAETEVKNGTQANPIQVECSDMIEYTLVITNTGDVNLPSGTLVASDEIPKNSTLVPGSDVVVLEPTSSAVVNAMQFDGTTVSWDISGMKGIETIRLTFRVQVMAAIPAGFDIFNIINQGHLSDPDVGTLLYEDTVLNPDGTVKFSKYDPVYTDGAEQDTNITYHDVLRTTATLDKTSNPTGDFHEGQIVTYSLKITVDSAPLHNWTLSDTIPQGLGFISGSLAEASGTIPLQDANYNAATRTITLTGGDPLPIGEYVITYQTLVEKLTAGTVEKQTNNTATLTGDAITEVSDTVENRVISRYAEIAKSSSVITLAAGDSAVTGGSAAAEDNGTAAAPVQVDAGQVVEYHIEITNHAGGDFASGDIVVSDKVPTGTTLVNGSISDKGTVASDGVTITWTLNGMVDAEKKIVTFRVYAPTVVDETTHTADFTNIASMRDTEVEGRVYGGNVTVINENGPTPYRQGDPMYTEADVIKVSNATYHEEKLDGQLTIVKRVYDYHGNLLSSAKKFSIKVTGPSYPSGMTMTLSNTTPIILQYLLYGEYMVEELNATNYTVTVSNPVTLSRSSNMATIDVTNKEKNNTLPVTGEDNTLLTVIGILILLLGAGVLVLGYQKRRKHTDTHR